MKLHRNFISLEESSVRTRQGTEGTEFVECCDEGNMGRFIRMCGLGLDGYENKVNR